ncbi:MAG: nucleotidyltransferase domain-containing protein [Terracidiphilus sp.]
MVRKTIGRQNFYQANRNSPIFPEMRKLLLKTSGVSDVLREALTPLTQSIDVAFVYGSMADQRDRASSDLDLMIIGSADFNEVVSRLGKAQEKLRREINPTVYPSEEWRSKLGSGNHFLTSVLNGRKVFVIGTEHDLRELSSKRLAKHSSKQPGRNREPTGRRRHQNRRLQ